MIQSFRQLKNRIKSVDNTRKITRAMEMVSAAKLTRVKGPFFTHKNYFVSLERIFFSFLSDIEPVNHPLLEERKEKTSVSLVVIASDTGLCSTYNNNIMNAAGEFAESIGRQRIKITAVGKEAFIHFKRDGYDVENSYLGLRGRFSENLAQQITDALINSYLNRSSDETYIAYTHFSSNLRHRPVVEKFLNIEYPRKTRNYYILEPDKEAILDELVSRYLLDKIRVMLMDSMTAEHSARMLAMKLATDNADELIDTLTLLKNKARQAAITKEVLEIAMSAEALKG